VSRLRPRAEAPGIGSCPRDLFELLAERGVINLRIVGSTGMEGSAAWVSDAAERTVGLATGGRVWVSRIEARASRNNVVTLTAAPATAPGRA
jgi:hypothetical protein